MTSGRTSAVVLRFALPSVVLVLALGYLGMATLGGVNPPVVPVRGDSMGPALQNGDLAFLERPGQLRKGDVVAISVPSVDRRRYGLPAHLVHRIVKVGHDASGTVLTTEGDANSGFDPFRAHAKDVIGQLWFDVPALGYPVLFLSGLQGQIFLGAAILLVLLYVWLGLAEGRRLSGRETAGTVQALREETSALRARSSVLLDTVATLPEPSADELFDELREASQLSRETAETMRELVGAIGEYGEHLRSHTAVMETLAATTVELHRATTELRLTLAGGLSGAAPAPRSRTAQRRRLDERAVRIDDRLAELDVAVRAAVWPALATADE